jgi:hypothetical protein
MGRATVILADWPALFTQSTFAPNSAKIKALIALRFPAV